MFVFAGQGVPVSVKSQGAGTLFEKVELEDENEDGEQKPEDEDKQGKEEDKATVKEK